MRQTAHELRWKADRYLLKPCSFFHPCSLLSSINSDSSTFINRHDSRSIGPVDSLSLNFVISWRICFDRQISVLCVLTAWCLVAVDRALSACHHSSRHAFCFTLKLIAGCQLHSCPLHSVSFCTCLPHRAVTASNVSFSDSATPLLLPLILLHSCLLAFTFNKPLFMRVANQ